jgi:predicted nuclease of predicted toxin-antitoxin system
MRFLADENVSGFVVERLRSDGHDVVLVAETSAGASDKDVLGAADAHDRILITEDRDFGEMIIRQRIGTRGVILLELYRLSNAAEAAAVAEAVAAHADKLLGSLVVVEPGRIRVRPLP